MPSSRNAEVILIGGGVTALGTALYLKGLGVERVTVLERHHVGAGQSGRAAGILRALVAHPEVSSMLLESIGFFETFSERYGQPIEVRRCGYLLVSGRAHHERMGQSLDAAAASGCRADRVSHQEARELQPGLGLDDDCVCAFEPGAIWTDPMSAVQAITRAAKALGVIVIEGCEVQRVLHRFGRVTGVDTKEGDFNTPLVLIATAAWGAPQLASLGIDVPVYPHRVEMAFFQTGPGETRRPHRILSDSRSQLYLRPEGNNQMFVGWREGDRIGTIGDLQPADPDNYRQSSHYASLADMHRRLTYTLPFMADGFVHRTYACVYDYTPDAMPVLDRAGDLEGLYFALGFSGGGFSLSPWVGRVMAESMVRGRVPAQMQLLGLHRYRENRLIEWSNAPMGAEARQ